MGNTTKVTVSEALDKATTELSASEEKEPVEKEAPPSETPEAEPEPAPVESDGEPKEEPEEEDEEAAAASSEDVVDEAIRKSLDRSSAKPETKEKLVDLLVEHLKSEIKSGKPKGTEGPMDISQIDAQDPQSVQKYVDSRISHAVMSALQPLQREMALRQADSELKKLMSDHSDAHKYGKAMAALIDKHPELPLEYAYRIAKSEDHVKEGVEKAYKNMAKKKSATLATSTVKSPAESPKKPKNAREAVLMAMDEVGATFGEA